MIEFLKRQRWFGAKSRELAGIAVLDEVSLAPEPAPVRAVLVRVRFREGADEIYQLVAGERGGDLVLDVLSEPDACRALARAILGRGAPLDGLPVRPIGAEQSNSSIVLGDALVLKVFRKIEAGENPEVELGRFLTSRAELASIPRFHGSLEYSGPALPKATLAVLQQFVKSRGDGWSEALAAARAGASFAEPARALGRTTAELHLALASPPAKEEPAIAPEPVEPVDLAEWARAMRERLERGRDPSLAAERTAIEAAYAELERIGAAGMKTRIHGDYHLGQVLRSERGDWIIFDFEGEPARSLEERRQKVPPLRDVAGMLRSFDYAACASGMPGAEARAFESAARRAFLDGYFGTLGPSPILPPDEPARATLLSCYELDKAVYELQYELDNRPDWARIPREGLARLLRARAP